MVNVRWRSWWGEGEKRGRSETNEYFCIGNTNIRTFEILKILYKTLAEKQRQSCVYGITFTNYVTFVKIFHWYKPAC